MSKRRTVRERAIDAPVLALRLNDEVSRLKTEPEWKSGLEDGITLAKYPHMRVVMVALKGATSMREHRVKGPMSLFVVSGNVSLVVEKKEIELKEKGLFTLRRSVLHDVRAKTDSVLLLTIVAL